MLLDLFGEHRAAFEYDWRNRFHLGLSAIPSQMDWAEAWRLFELLAADGSAYVGAALSGWAQPASRTDLTLRDLYDLQHRSKAKRKPEPYPRPWPDRVKKISKPSPDITQDQVIAALRFAGHTAELPAA